MKTIKDTYANSLNEIEELIKNSEFESAQRRLLALRKKKVPADFLLRFSHLARRAELPSLGITTLSPAVHPRGRKKIIGSDEHVVEYAACLIRVGACREANKLLSSKNLDSNLEALFFRAGLHVKEWNYSQAVPLFREYVEKTATSPYTCSIGRINLALSLVFEEKYDEAALLINEVLTTDGNAKWKLVKGNAYRILGGLEFYRGNYEFALNAFHHAHKIFVDSKSIDHFLIKKWVHLTNYFLSKGSKPSLAEVQKNREEAVQRQHWESVRDIDYQLAVFHHDDELLLKVYFGTPFEGFRKRLLKRVPDLVVPETYQWRIGEKLKGKVVRFSEKDLGLKPGLSLYRLYLALTSDFYRSITAVELFEKTFPEDFYIPGSAEQRVYQVISRLRREFSKSIPLTIDSNDHPFRLVATGPIEIQVIQGNAATKKQYNHRLEQIKEQVRGTPFSSAFVAEQLNLARRSANELVAEALKEGQILQIGAGNRTRYVFVNAGEVPLKKAG